MGSVYYLNDFGCVFLQVKVSVPIQTDSLTSRLLIIYQQDCVLGLKLNRESLLATVQITMSIEKFHNF